MDQGKAVRIITLVTVLMLLYAGQASASFKSCYMSCTEDCFARGGERTACIVKCIVKCLKGANACKLKCAADQCPAFGGDAGKVDDCVNKCDTGQCNKHGSVTAAAADSFPPY